MYDFLRYVKKEKLFMVYIIKKVTDVRIITIITNEIKNCGSVSNTCVNLIVF